MTVDAVEKYYHKNIEIRKIFVVMCAYSDETVNGKEFVPDEKVALYIQARINFDDAMADKAEVSKAECFCEPLFPEYEGGKFLGEDIV